MTSRTIFDLIDTPKSSPSPEKPSTPVKTVFDLPPPSNTWTKPEPPPVGEQLKNVPGIIGREGAAGLYSLPHNLGETYRFLSGKLQQYGEDLAKKEGREITDQDRELTNKFVNYVPDLIQSLHEKYPKIFPSYQEAKKTIGEKIEKSQGVKIPQEPRGFIERSAKGAADALPLLFFPGSAAVKGAGIATSAITEGSGLSEGKKLGANLTIPALTSLIQAIVQKRYIPKPGEAQKLYDAGKGLGLTEKELAPILATEGQVATHGRRAASVKGTKEAFENTGNVLGSQLQGLQSLPASQVPLSAQAQQTLVNRLTALRSSISNRSHALSPQTQSTVDFLDQTIKDINANGGSPSKSIGTWREVNKIRAGKSELARIKPILKDSIDSVNPQLGKDFEDLNSLYSRYSKNIKEIRPTEFNSFMDAGELQQVLGAVFTADPTSITRAVLRKVTVKSLERVSSKILTDPRAQSLGRNFVKSVKDGSPASARAVGIQLKEYVRKNLPEEYKEIDWEDLGI